MDEGLPWRQRGKLHASITAMKQEPGSSFRGCDPHATHAQAAESAVKSHNKSSPQTFHWCQREKDGKQKSRSSCFDVVEL